MISLCIITGNEAAHIERMLASFAGGFDELSLVRAIGKAEPDDTVARAETWCMANGKAFRFTDYYNDAEFAHVDDFAAARNQSFAQAGGDWLIWADCDDICSAAAEIRRIVERMASGKFDFARLPYEIPQSSKVTLRERIISRRLFEDGRRWKWCVHENLVPSASDACTDYESPCWIHAPTGPKAGGTGRNIAILTHALRDAPTNYYYLHQEHYWLGNREEAIRYGRLFVDLPGAAPSLVYQSLIWLSFLSHSKSDAATYALRAHHLFPDHKEAIAALVYCALQEESADRALHWSSILIEKPRLPLASRLWCYEPRWDGWGKFDLRARALRLAGKNAAAASADWLIHHDAPEFSLIHATRGRAQQAIATRDAWLAAADRPEDVEHIFAVDADDAFSLRWLKQFKRVVSSASTCVAAWNAGAEAALGGVLIQLSDDWAPFRGWDTALRAKYAGRNPELDPFVIAPSDGTRTDNLLCMAILSRARYDAQGGEMFSGEYESVFSDNEFSFRAYRDGVVIEARDLTFEHNHPAFGKAAMDETYRRQNAPEKYQRGEATFRRRNPDAL